MVSFSRASAAEFGRFVRGAMTSRCSAEAVERSWCSKELEREERLMMAVGVECEACVDEVFPLLY